MTLEEAVKMESGISAQDKKEESEHEDQEIILESKGIVDRGEDREGSGIRESPGQCE